MSADAVELLQQGATGAGLLVSDISVWEIGNKAAKGKLTLLFSTQRPGTVHGDPADRMLIATAALGGIPLITADRLILAYAEESRLLSVCDVRP